MKCEREDEKWIGGFSDDCLKDSCDFDGGQGLSATTICRT